MPFFVLAVFLYTFTTSNAIALKAPTNIRMDGAELSWYVVCDASEYQLGL